MTPKLLHLSINSNGFVILWNLWIIAVSDTVIALQSSWRTLNQWCFLAIRKQLKKFLLAIWGSLILAIANFVLQPWVGNKSLLLLDGRSPLRAKKASYTAFSWRSHEVLRRDDL